jgi:hypothetical protein
MVVLVLGFAWAVSASRIFANGRMTLAVIEMAFATPDGGKALIQGRVVGVLGAVGPVIVAGDRWSIGVGAGRVAARRLRFISAKAESRSRMREVCSSNRCFHWAFRTGSSMRMVSNAN